MAAVIGLVASFHAIIFASGRQIYSLSRAGYFPHFLSVTHGEHKTPNIALVAGAAVGLAVMLVVWFAMGGERAGAFIGGVLLNMAVFGAMFSYLLQGLTFIRLRRRFPTIERPYRSPFGVLGAALTVHHRARDHRLSACRSALPHRSDRRVDLVCDSDRLLRSRKLLVAGSNFSIILSLLFLSISEKNDIASACLNFSSFTSFSNGVRTSLISCSSNIASAFCSSFVIPQ